MKNAGRTWVIEAVRRVEADACRSADTHLIPLHLKGFPGIEFYLKDESRHPTGSLKHRLARSLVLHGLCSGRIGPQTTLIDASSGSTAISEAYFAQLLGLPFVAVAPRFTASAKLAAIKAAGGEVVLAEPADIYRSAEALAEEVGGLYLDQFTNAEAVTDWRGNNNIAEAMLAQMAEERHSIPTWIVVGLGTGGTSATIGRYLRYNRRYGATRLMAVDPENSVFLDAYAGRPLRDPCPASRIEGIGRPRVEPSFVPTVIDRMARIPDPASIAAAEWLYQDRGVACGPSTGTNIVGALTLAQEMIAAGEGGSIVSLLCDGRGRYLDTVFCPAWRELQGIDPTTWLDRLEACPVARLDIETIRAR